MNYPKTIKSLIEGYKKLPGIGEKSAERLALATINLNQEVLEDFSIAIKDSHTKIKRCSTCNSLSESDECEICSDKTRNKTTICVVEDVKNVFSFEKIGSYSGVYHVLDGLISPLDGINPEDINIENLIQRIEKEKTKEIIIAIKPSIEGETTALYLTKRLEGMEVIVSKIAYGIPIGADMDYIDSLTLERAIEDRKKIS
jgi:recombination protein RecR